MEEEAELVGAGLMLSEEATPPGRGGAAHVNPDDAQGAAVPGEPIRSRGAAGSRGGLLEGAQELFGRSGFERTTVRETSERAGVDAALLGAITGDQDRASG